MDTTIFAIKQALESLFDKGSITYVDMWDLDVKSLQKAIEHDIDLEMYDDLEEVVMDLHLTHGLEIFKRSKKSR